MSVSGAGIFTGSAAEVRLRDHALAGDIDDSELSFESGDKLRGKFLVTRLDYAGDYNGERSYTLSLESSGAVAALLKNAVHGAERRARRDGCCVRGPDADCAA